jgi:hypothetical protein
MPITADWVTAISTAVSTTAILLIGAQTLLLRKQIREDHERSRRDRAVDLILQWTERLQLETSSARKLVEALSEQQCISLSNIEPLDIPVKLKSLVETCLALSSTDQPKEENGVIRLQEKHVAVIRWQVVQYLNTLEAITAAWRHNVADREVLVEQFGYLVDSTKGYSALEKFRVAAGGRDVFPAIADFAEKLKERREQHPKGKGILG